jgi:NhaP-type Na+/H+ or K+/H+ antiporter
MKRVIVYSLLLIAGMSLSQMGVSGSWVSAIRALTMILLAYIMIEVGMEFDIDKSHLRQYGTDALITMGAAAIPWLFAAGYFWWVFNLGIEESLLVGRFACRPPPGYGLRCWPPPASPPLGSTKQRAFWRSSMTWTRSSS